MNKLKILGFVTLIGGAAISLVTEWVNQKQMEETVKEEVERQLSEMNNEEES